MEDNPFIKILERKIPAYIVYEDDTTLAFLDAHPNNPGHTLVIPKEPYKNIFDIPEDIFSAMTKTAQRLSPIIRDAVSADGINIHMNNERAAGQVVFHAHIHIIPRFENDGYKHWGHKPYKEGEAESIAASIRGNISQKS
jgi:histidine triad (HIT) family protein